MDDVRVRRLNPEEHDRLVGLGPFAYAKMGPDPDSSTVVVAESPDGEILGFWCAFNAIHVEPLWIAESQRNNGVGLSLWRRLQEVLHDFGTPGAFAIIMDDDLPTHLPMAHGIGFRRISGSILYVDLEHNGEDEVDVEVEGVEEVD